MKIISVENLEFYEWKGKKMENMHVYMLDQELANFFCKGSDSKYYVKGQIEYISTLTSLTVSGVTNQFCTVVQKQPGTIYKLTNVAAFQQNFIYKKQMLG